LRSRTENNAWMNETSDAEYERRYRQSDQRFRALGRATGSMVWTTSPSGLDGDMPDWTTITGRPNSSRAWGWLDAVHPDDRARAAETWAEAVNRAEAYTIDYRLEAPDGTYRWHKARGVPTFEDGELSEWVGVIEDIDDRVTFERERDRFFNLGVDMMVVAGFDGYFKRVSPKWTELLGWTQEELVSQPYLDFVHPDDHPSSLAERDKLYDGYETLDFENRYLGKDGSYRWISWRVQPYPEERLLYCAATDVTERKASERTVRESEERYRATFDNAAVGIAHVGLDGRWLRFNDAICRTIGYTREELLAMTFADITHPDDLEADWAQAKAVAQGDIETYSMEKRYRRRDGFFVWVNLTVSMLFDAAGRPQYYIAVVEDISRQKLVEAELERLVEERTAELRAANEALIASRDAALAGSRAKGQFLANMSHEVRTPMNGVIGMTSLLLEKDLDSDTLQIVQTIATSGATLLRVIDDILDLSQIEAGKLGIERTQTDLDEVANDVMALFQGHSKPGELELIANPPARPTPKVLADPVRIRQVLSNLVSNAVKFTEKGSVELTWRWQPEADSVAVEFLVRDTGVGIPRERHADIFDSFTQADGSTRRRFGGTGLGLSICKRLVEIMGGRLTVESEPGQGACFRVTLTFDAAVMGEAMPVSVPVLVRGGPGRKLHVLLAEDNEINVQVVTRMLEDCGCTVEVAENGLRAISLAASVSYDLVLMDVQMPVCDGLEAARSIRQAEARVGGARLPIVALTANAMREDQEQCLAAGMDGFLPKPIPLATLRALVEDIRMSSVK